MKTNSIKKPGWRNKALSLLLAAVMLCMLAAVLGQGGGGRVSGSYSGPVINGGYMQETVAKDDSLSVFGNNVVLYFSDKSSNEADKFKGPPAYCLHNSRTGPVSSTKYNSMAVPSFGEDAYLGLCALLLHGYPNYDGGLNKYVAHGYTQVAVYYWLHIMGEDTSGNWGKSIINESSINA